MSAAIDPLPVELVSPELVLVDPELRARAVDILRTWEHALAPAIPERARRPRPRVFPVAFPDDGSVIAAGAATEALNRLVESANEPDVFVSRKHLHRATTLVPTSSAAAAGVLYFVQLGMLQGLGL